MDILIEIIIDLLLEGSLEICSNKKINKWIRYTAFVILSLFIIIVILGILLIGIYFIKESLILSIILIGVSILLTTIVIIKFKNIYKDKN